MNKRDAFNEINITPLTDIFLVLLIIMMVIAPMLDHQGMGLLLPSAVQAESTENKFITVEVAEDSTLSIGGKTVEKSNLLAEIKNLLAKQKEGLLIRADGEVEYGSVIHVMDIAKVAGIDSISVIEK